MEKPLHLNKKNPWILGEDIPDMDFFFSQIWLSGFSNEFHRSTGRAYKKAMSIHQGYHLWFYYDEKDSKEVGDHLVKRFIENPNFVKQINREIVKKSDDLRKFAEKLPTKNLADYSNRQLADFLKRHDKLHTIYYQWGWMPVAADMFHNNFTEKVKQFLRSIDVAENKINEYLVILTQPTKKSVIQKEHEEFLNIVAEIQADNYHKKLFSKNLQSVQNGVKLELLKKIEKFYSKYFYVARMWVGEVSTLEHYLQELINIVKSGVSAKTLIKKEDEDFLKTIKQREDLLRQLGIKGKWQVLLDGFGNFMLTKMYRRYAQLYALYKMNFILGEFAKRMNLTIKEARFMLPSEIQSALLRGNLPQRSTLKKRTKFCVFYVEKGFEKVFIGKQAKALAKQVEQKVGDVSELYGQTGCVGRAQGIVRIIIRPKDMKKMNKGDILVSIATDPDIVPAMKIAGAIVTEQGGVTSHAAIVARELNKPCVIGTKIATRVLKDGDMVEVDAYKGVVKKI